MILETKKEMLFDTNEINNIFFSNIKNIEKISLSTDSRILEKNQIFLPLAGERFDGHSFINELLLKNPNTYCFCEKNKVAEIKEEYKPRLVLIENSLEAYHKIANYYRKKINPKVIAITGSSGKTTSKELLASVLSQKYKVYKTRLNYNNEIGVPKTILEMPEETEILILELAMRAKGEIRLLSRTAEPDIAIITNIGTAHIGILGSVKAIMEAKSEILEHLKKDGLAILHSNPELLSYIKNLWKGKQETFDFTEATNIKFDKGFSTFNIEDQQYSINALGNVQILNSLMAIKVAKSLNLTQDEIKKGLLNFSIPNGRGNVISISNNEEIFIIDEAYNANPESVKSAVLNLLDYWHGYKKILVLGELAELGEHEEKLMKELMDWIKGKSLSSVITVGEKMKHLNSSINVESIDECCAILDKLVLPKTVIAVKGSRIAGLEKVIKHFV